MNKTNHAASSYEKTDAMGKEKISKLLLRFSGPAIIAAETFAFYNLLDAVWVGYLGNEALAALTVANPLMAIYRAVGAGIGVGAASLISRKLGAGKKEEASSIAGCSISVFFIVAGLTTVVCLVNLEPLLRIFGANDAVLPFATSYMLIETVFIALDFFLILLVELVRVQGAPKLASASLITASILDIIFSPILVFGVGPFPELGIAGAALGTTIGRAIGVAILLAYIGLGKSIYQFSRACFIPSFKKTFDIYRIGISQSVRAGSISISQAVANNIAISFGVVPLAILGVLFKLNIIVFAFCIGLSQGMLPLVGYNYAAQNKDRVGEIVVKTALASIAWGTLCWTVTMLFPTQIISLFGTDTIFLSGGTTALYIFALTFFSLGIQINLSSFFQGIGKGVPSLVLAASRDLIFLIPFLLIMPNIFGIAGLWAAYPAATALSLTLSLIWTRHTFRANGIPFRLRSHS